MFGAYIHEKSPIAIGEMAKFADSQFESTGWQVLGTGIREGLHTSSLGALGGMASWYAAGSPEMAGNENTPDEESWKSSPHFREGVKFSPGVTWNQYQLLAQRKDAEEHNQFIMSHAKSGASAVSLNILGNLLGSVPDPVNYIPVSGPLHKAFLAAKYVEKIPGFIKVAKTLERGVMAGAVDAAVSTAAIQPLIFANEKLYQGDPDIGMALMNVGLSGIIGGGFGAIAKGIGNISDRSHAEILQTAVNSLTESAPVNTNKLLHRALSEDVASKHVARIAELEAEKKSISLSRVPEGIKEIPYAGLTERELVLSMKAEIERGSAGQRLYKKDVYGVVESVEGAGSTFPEYFRGKGYKKKEILAIIDKKLNDKELTSKQAAKLEELVQGKTSELESQKQIIKVEEAREAAIAPRSNVMVSELRLTQGDTFAMYGDQYRVIGVGKAGEVSLESEDGGKFIVSADSELPSPDIGSMVRTKEAHPRITEIDKEIADLKARISDTAEINFETGEEIKLLEEVVLRENKEVPGYENMDESMAIAEQDLKDLSDRIQGDEAISADTKTQFEQDLQETKLAQQEIAKVPMYARAYKAAIDCLLGKE